MTSGKRVQLPPAPELTDGPDLVLRQPVAGDVDDIVAQCRDPEFQRWTHDWFFVECSSDFVADDCDPNCGCGR